MAFRLQSCKQLQEDAWLHSWSISCKPENVMHQLSNKNISASKDAIFWFLCFCCVKVSYTLKTRGYRIYPLEFCLISADRIANILLIGYIWVQVNWQFSPVTTTILCEEFGEELSLLWFRSHPTWLTPIQSCYMLMRQHNIFCEMLFWLILCGLFMNAAHCSHLINHTFLSPSWGTMIQNHKQQCRN